MPKLVNCLGQGMPINYTSIVAILLQIVVKKIWRKLRKEGVHNTCSHIKLI